MKILDIYNIKGCVIMKKRIIFFIIGIVAFSAIFVGCSSSSTTSNKDIKEIPSLKVGYVFTNHQTPLMVAASLGEIIRQVIVTFFR
jgi:NitT/TauT family transport system substrate-binding protein